MRITYYPETDSLYIKLRSCPIEYSEEIREGVVLDLDAQGNLVGIEVYNDASRVVELDKVVLERLPHEWIPHPNNLTT